MGYCEHLKKTLQPLQIYELDTGIGATELEVEGAAMDGIEAILSDTLRNMLPATADESGFEFWKKLFPFLPASGSLEDRREALVTLLNIGQCECSDQGLNFVLGACGLPANVSETSTKELLKVTILDDELSDSELQKVKDCVEAILPCHLEISYE